MSATERDRIEEALTFFGSLVHMNGHDWHPDDLDEAKRSLGVLTEAAARLEGGEVVAWVFVEDGMISEVRKIGPTPPSGRFALVRRREGG